MWSMGVYSKASLLLWRAGSNPSLGEEDSSLRSASRRWRQLPRGMESISPRFTTPMDQWRTNFIARRNGREVELPHLSFEIGCRLQANSETDLATPHNGTI